MKVSAKELRTRTKHILEAVSRGESVTITYRGKARAKLVALHERATDTRDAMTQQTLFGIWKDHGDTDDVEGYVDNLRASRV